MSKATLLHNVHIIVGGRKATTGIFNAVMAQHGAVTPAFKMLLELREKFGW